MLETVKRSKDRMNSLLFRCNLDYYIMNKCEHGERITTFCASDCCVWKQAAGCDTCMKKYHNHMGPTIFLSEEEVVSLVKKYMMDSNIKPKCRLLQQAIYAYLNQIKTEVAASIDVLCKNIINQIGYPFLYSNNTLSVYKRLKNKQYKKVVQKQFKTLYQLSLKVNQKDLIKQETKIYQQQMKKTEELLHSLEQVMKKYEFLIKGCHNSFVHDSSCMLKINDMMKSLHQQSKSSLKTQRSKDQRESSSSSSKQGLYTPILSKQKEEVKKEEAKEIKLFNAFQSKNTNNETTITRSPLISSPPLLTKPNYSRDVSIDRKIVKERKFTNITPAKEKDKDQAQTETHSLQSGEKQKQKQIERSKQRSNEKEKEKLQPFRPQLNSKEIELNERKKILIQMMKQKEDSLKIVKQRSIKETIDSKEVEQTKSKFQLEIPSFFKRQTSSKNNINPTTQSQRQNTSEGNAKSSNNQSQENSNNQLQVEERLKSQENDVHIQAFTQLPFVEKQSRKQSQRQQVKQKVIFVPKSSQFQQMSANITEINSPIIKQLNKSNVFNKPKEKQQTKQKQYKSIVREEESRYQTYSNKRQQVLQLKQNQQKSLALLMKSLTLNADEGIKYLQSALCQAQNNLSAAQYLTYLYLEQQKPQNCLHLCNKMLLKLEDSSQPEELSLIINNNKAAALNILGRYSQAIYILQKCLKYREKDYLYKNLGDSYFSIAIYEKAIYNYEKALKINQCYDEAQYNLAVCLYIQQNYFNAKLAIKKALQMQPQNEAYLQLSFNIETRITHC